MIRIVAKQTVKTEKIEEFITRATELVKKTKELDEGCISYDLYQDITNPCILTIIEEWASKEALDKHSKATHFIQAVPALRELTVGNAELNIYQKIS